MKINFKLINKQHVDIMSGSKVIGQIFTPGGTGEIYENAIQVCGFEEAYDLWGCGVFGEETTEKIYYSPEQKQRYKELAVATKDTFYNTQAEKGFYEQKKTKMKRDIQLLFKEYDAKPFPPFGTMKCYQCYNDPCNCNERVIKRGVDLNAQLKLERVQANPQKEKPVKIEIVQDKGKLFEHRQTIEQR